MTRGDMRVQIRGVLTAWLALVVLAAGCDGGATDEATPSTVSPSTTTTPGSTTTTTLPGKPSSDTVWAGEPEVRAITDYTAGLGITEEEAQRRNALVDTLIAGDLPAWLDRRGVFLWVEETPETWALVVARNRVFKGFVAQVDERVAGTPLAGLVEMREVEHELEELRRTEARIKELVEDWCLPPPTLVEIDYPRNQVVIGVQSVNEFVAAAAASGVSFETNEVVLEAHPIEASAVVDTEPCEAPLEALGEARVRWASSGADRYTYRVTAFSAWIGSVDVGEVLVWDGEVTETIPPELTPGELLYPGRFGIRYGTVERLFDIVESHPVQWMMATYDPELGFPTGVSFNHPDWFDDGWGFRIEDFRRLDSVPDPVPPRQARFEDGSLEIENRLHGEVVVVDALIHPTSGVSEAELSWRHPIDVTRIVYSSPGAEPPGSGLVDVTDPIGSAPRALLHRDGESARLILTPSRDGGFRVFAVVESTPEGLRLDGPLVGGMSEELGYLCHYPRTDIPTDPPPERDAAAEFDLVLGWLNERGTIGPDTDWAVANKEALRRVCEQG